MEENESILSRKPCCAYKARQFSACSVANPKNGSRSLYFLHTSLRLSILSCIQQHWSAPPAPCLACGADRDVWSSYFSFKSNNEGSGSESDWKPWAGYYRQLRIRILTQQYIVLLPLAISSSIHWRFNSHYILLCKVNLNALKRFQWGIIVSVSQTHSACWQFVFFASLWLLYTGVVAHKDTLQSVCVIQWHLAESPCTFNTVSSSHCQIGWKWFRNAVSKYRDTDIVMYC